MLRVFALTLIAIHVFNGVLSASIIPAKDAKKISLTATKKVMHKFMHDKKTKAAYQETEKYVNTLIKKVANEGFYDIVHIQILEDFGKQSRKMKFNKLSKKEKDILKFILKNKLESLGYRVKEGKYDIMGLDWWIAW